MSHQPPAVLVVDGTRQKEQETDRYPVLFGVDKMRGSSRTFLLAKMPERRTKNEGFSMNLARRLWSRSNTKCFSFPHQGGIFCFEIYQF